jgi:hypothetical protein
MAWALEYTAPGNTGDVYQMHIWLGEVWAIGYDNAAAGVWYRTPGGGTAWTRTISAPGAGRAEIWDGQMFWTATTLGGPRYISVSPDGVNWAVDHDFGVAAYSHWSALGGMPGTDLYMAMQSFQGVANTTVYHRDTLGNYAAIPNVVPDNTHGEDIIEYGTGAANRIYWCDQVNCYERPPNAWQLEATLNNYCEAFTYNPGDGLLYAVYQSVATNNWQVWRRSLVGAWALDHDFGLGSWGFGHISIGSDGNLYVAARDGANTSRVYVRSGGVWSQITNSPMNGAQFRSAIESNGSYFAGTEDGEFWGDTPDCGYGVSSGLYPQGLACDNDGSRLYIALDDGGTPVLLSVTLPLVQATSLATTVFTGAAAGDAINVAAIGVTGDLAISGYFDANDQVERSVNFGGAWTDSDPGTWGAVRAQPLLVQANDVGVILVARDTVPDLWRRSTLGVWTSPNAAMPYTVGAMAGSAVASSEVVFGNILAAARQIDRSVDGGATLMDITGAFGGGGVAALDVAQEV